MQKNEPLKKRAAPKDCSGRNENDSADDGSVAAGFGKRTQKADVVFQAGGLVGHGASPRFTSRSYAIYFSL
jgi:hypothetical protein